MAKAKKLPSGQWRTLVYSHKDLDGKRRYESFTADTKKESEYLAAQYALNKDQVKRPKNITIKQAVSEYIELKTPILSPSTITAYKSISNTLLDYIAESSVRDPDSTHLQKWVNSLTIDKSPKTVRNAWGLVVSAIKLYNPKADLSIELPAKKRPALYIPTDQEINTLLSHIIGKELEIAVYLAAFGPMRRGEICAVESTDVKGNNIAVNKSMVLCEDKTWAIKQPKTYAGYRTIEYPDFVISRISGITGRLVKATPDQISHRFERALKSAKLPNHFRFHDLRHYAASIMHAIGVPDQYIMGRGGWASDYVLKSVYRNELDDQKRKFTNTINGYFDSMQHEMQHKKS